MNSLLYGWEIRTLIPDPRDGEDKRRICATAIVAAHTIDQIWKYIAADRADSRTEIESIVRFGPILAVLESPSEPQPDQTPEVGT
jgi:hypothetical protein